MYRYAVAASLFIALTAAAVRAQPVQDNKPRLPPDTMEARVMACVGCHGENGGGVQNVYFPRLAGKPAGYLYNQLVAFQEGRRRYAPMNYLLAYLPRPYLQKMAEYFAAQTPAPIAAARPQVAPEVIQAGERIVTGGIPGKQIPACVACHGTALTGREPGIPGLLGLRADYISAQLGAWRYGTRTALAPDCMQVIASTLTEAEVHAVSSYLATLDIPRQDVPIKRDTGRLPLVCGSQQS